MKTISRHHYPSQSHHCRGNIKVHEDAINTLNDILEQRNGNGVDLSKQPFIFGPELKINRYFLNFLKFRNLLMNSGVKEVKKLISGLFEGVKTLFHPQFDLYIMLFPSTDKLRL